MKVFLSPDIQVRVLAPYHPSASEILSDDALRFLGLLCYKFEDRRKALLKQRETLATEYDALQVPRFQNSVEISESSWKCAKVPSDVTDRRVEITGPVDRKMIINGLNSGANVYMADFEDSSSPTWNNIIDGQRNLKDAVDGTISFTNDRTGKVYRLNQQKTAVLFVRPRGWHLDEAHITINGQPASGSIVDFALYFYHNIHKLLRKGTSAYYYLPKLESSFEARLWNDCLSCG
jgi:Malate synthase